MRHVIIWGIFILAGFPVFAESKSSTGWSAITAGEGHICAIKAADNKLYCWGKSYHGQLGDGKKGAVDAKGHFIIKTIPIKIGDDTWSEIKAGYAHTCGIKTDGKLYCWGYNNDGQLGDGTSCPNSSPDTCADKAVPTRIGDDTWSTIAVGFDESGRGHTCGIKTSDSKLYCWGYNSYGQLGNGTAGNGTEKNTPTKIDDDEWVAISAGGGHACGIKAKDKKLYCWGYNNHGQIGDGSSGDVTAAKLSPVKISDEAWLKISAGGQHTCGIKAVDNKLYCWGLNQYGQLGNATKTEKHIPTKTGDDTWLKITTGMGGWGIEPVDRWSEETTDNHDGGGYTCGIKTDSKLYCWGSNDSGQIGNGTIKDKSIPTKIGNDTWIEIVAGGANGYTCGIKTDHNLYCWGFGKTKPTLVK